MKRSIIITIILLIYLIVMAIIGWPYYSEKGEYLQFATIFILTLIIIIILYFVLKRRDKFRSETKKRKDASNRRSFRDDKIR